MLQPAVKIWKDESGFIVTIELILIATIIGIGSIVGFVLVRDALNFKLAELAEFIQTIEFTSDDGGNGNNGNGNGNNGNGNGNATLIPPSTCIDFSQPPTDEN